MADFGNLGKDTSQFLLNDCDVYILDGTATSDWKLLGSSGAIKEINGNEKYAEYSEGIPRVVAAKKKVGMGLTVKHDLMEWDAQLLAAIAGGTYSTGASGAEITFGTGTPIKASYAMRYVTEREDGKLIVLTLYKAQMDVDGTLKIGDESYSPIPMLVTALFDSNRSATDNLYRISIWDTGISPTGDVP